MLLRRPSVSLRAVLLRACRPYASPTTPRHGARPCARFCMMLVACAPRRSCSTARARGARAAAQRARAPCFCMPTRTWTRCAATCAAAGALQGSAAWAAWAAGAACARRRRRSGVASSAESADIERSVSLGVEGSHDVRPARGSAALPPRARPPSSARAKTLLEGEPRASRAEPRCVRERR